MPEKKVLMVIAPHGFDDGQHEICRRLWQGHGDKVIIASLERGTARGEAGTPVPVDLALKDVKSWDYDAIAFLGGQGARLLFDDEGARKLAKDAKYKVLAASDSAVVLLALAGCLEGKKVTGPPESAHWILKGGGVYTRQPIKVDDKLITVQGVGMAEQMANAVIKALEK